MSTTPDDPAAPPPIDPPDWPAPAATEPPVWSPPPAAAPAASSPAEPLNAWVHIWTRPRAVMRQVLDTNPRRMVHLLAIAGGIIETLGANRVNLPGFEISLPALIAVKIVVGILGGLLGLYLTSALMVLTGRWVGGHGTFVTVRAATAWSNVPAIWAGLLWLPLFVYLGWEAFNLDGDALLGDPIGLLLMVPIGFLTIVILVWHLVIFLKCVGEAHGFSAWHSFGALLIALVLLAIPVAIVAGAVVALFGLAVLGSR